MIAELAHDGAILLIMHWRRPDPARKLRSAPGRAGLPGTGEASARPAKTVAKRIGELKLHQIALRDGAVLETSCVYIVPLIERLALPDDIAARQPKSSTGGSTCSPA
jgi:hypothetical protein